MTLPELRQAVLDLPAEERQRLAEALWASLERRPAELRGESLDRRDPRWAQLGKPVTR